MNGDAVRLQHLLDAARKAVAVTAGKTRADLGWDDILALASVGFPEYENLSVSRAPRLSWLLEFFSQDGNLPTVPQFVLEHVKPAEEIVGGRAVWPRRVFPVQPTVVTAA